MPIYEYLCKKCGEFEIMQRITERPLSRCPTCKSRVTKLISNTSFQLKGSGWYATDYARKGSSATDASSPAADSSASDSSAKEKGESKSEGKGEVTASSKSPESKGGPKQKAAA